MYPLVIQRTKNSKVNGGYAHSCLLVLPHCSSSYQMTVEKTKKKGRQAGHKKGGNSRERDSFARLFAYMLNPRIYKFLPHSKLVKDVSGVLNEPQRFVSKHFCERPSSMRVFIFCQRPAIDKTINHRAGVEVKNAHFLSFFSPPHVLLLLFKRRKNKKRKQGKRRS